MIKVSRTESRISEAGSSEGSIMAITGAAIIPRPKPTDPWRHAAANRTDARTQNSKTVTVTLRVPPYYSTGGM
jgi:hypothetical protein